MGCLFQNWEAKKFFKYDLFIYLEGRATEREETKGKNFHLLADSTANSEPGQR